MTRPTSPEDLMKLQQESLAAAVRFVREEQAFR
jgi:hypothetical protein